jgi:hypothetical protein
MEVSIRDALASPISTIGERIRIFHMLRDTTRNGMTTTLYAAIIEKEGDLYAALCPELNVTGRGKTESRLHQRDSAIGRA